MAKSKGNRQYVRLLSTESHHCYYTQKNRTNTKERMTLVKYDPVVRRHVAYKEQGKL